MRFPVFMALSVALTAFGVPPPPGMFDAPSEQHLDWLLSYSEALERGVDAPNEVYGEHNPIVRALGDDQMNVLILLVDFPDKEAQTPALYFDSMGFAQDTFSLSSYYSEVSFGQIDIVTVNWPSETGWNRAVHDYGWYVNGNYGWGSYPQNSQGLVEEICLLVDPVIDFAQYDNDGDGLVDGVNLMYAGTFSGNPDQFWPHAWSLPGTGLSIDGVRVKNFSVQNEYNSSPGDKSASVVCHEFGHVLGLPDLYDYDYDSRGIGNWGIMAFGVYNGGGWSPAHFSPFCRKELGITQLVDITSAGCYEVPAIETSNVAYRLWTGGAPYYQYFILENRRQIGFDEYLPSQGILIWHVDESKNDNDHQWYPGCNPNLHYMVALEQADGLWELEHDLNSGDAGDPFPGSSSNDAFHYWTVPDSRRYTGEDTQVHVSAIPATSDTVEVWMSTSFTGIEGGGSPAAGISLAPGGVVITHPGGHASISVFDTAGRRVLSLFSGELPLGEHSFMVPGDELPTGLFMATYSSSGRISSVKVLSL